jgi:hypothetical protein
MLDFRTERSRVGICKRKEIHFDSCLVLVLLTERSAPNDKKCTLFCRLIADKDESPLDFFVDARHAMEKCVRHGKSAAGMAVSPRSPQAVAFFIRSYRTPYEQWPVKL